MNSPRPVMRPTTTLNKEINVEAAVAASEVRLRQMVMESLRGPLERISALHTEFATIKTLSNQQVKAVYQMQQEQYHASQQVNSIASFREEMTRWDTARLRQEQQVDDKLSAMQVRLDGFALVVESREVQLQELQRAADRLTQDVSFVQSVAESRSQATDQHVDELSSKLAQQATDIEIRMQSAEIAHHALVDELWGDELGVAKLGGELKRTNENLVKFQGLIEQLEVQKADLCSIEELRTDVEMTMRKAGDQMTSLKTSIGDVVTEVKDHFQTSMDTAATHNSALLLGVRQEHKAEMQKATETREVVAMFVSEMETRWRSVEDRLSQQNSVVSCLAAERNEEMEELYNQRKKDKTAAELHVHSLDVQVRGMQEQVTKNRETMQQIRSVQEMMLESDLMQASLEVQDVQDRQRIALMAIKDEEAAMARSLKNEPQKPRQEVRSRHGRQAGVDERQLPGTMGGETPSSSSSVAELSPVGTKRPQYSGGASIPLTIGKQAPVMRVDDRCIACSGQAPFVLSAFKLACLHYTPSPVPHRGRVQDRVELLDERRDLLEQAHSVLSDAGQAAGTAASGGTARVRKEPSHGDPEATGNAKQAAHALAPYAALQELLNDSARAPSESSPKLPQLNGAVVAATRVFASGVRPLTVR